MTHVAGRVVSALLVAVFMTAGCAARGGGVKGGAARSAPQPTAPPADSLETTIGKIRELSARARPRPKQVSGVTIEGLDQQLSAAWLALRTWPSAAAHRRVAEEYRRLGILDTALDHYRHAVRMDPRDGAAYDGVARIWRDWKLPALALGDAHRAVFHAPHSAEAYNTLGTVLQALHRRAEAKGAYRRSLELNPGAWYALNNLGYVLLLEGNEDAIDYFRRALMLGGDVPAARHNLALAYAASGRLDLARRELQQADAPAIADYNLGIIHLARRDQAAALAAFASACRQQPSQPLACERARVLRAKPAATPAGGIE